mmetsp:Transcript_59367/g.184286  ORF Transcript_59367/g.184286 Transcript_59367/m.184286 type:complete len:266 (+) Transcript_59367:967-1764(+)
MHDDAVEDRLAHDLQRDGEPLLLLRDGRVLAALDALQHLHGPYDADTVPGLDGQLVLEHEFLPLLPPDIQGGQVALEIVHHRRPARRRRAVVGLLAGDHVDGVGHAVRHRDEPLGAQGAILNDLGDNAALAEAHVAAPPQGLHLVKRLNALLSHELPQLLEHLLRKDLAHRHVVLARVVEEAFHTHHEVLILRVVVRQPVLEWVVVDRRDVPGQRGHGLLEELRALEVRRQRGAGGPRGRGFWSLRRRLFRLFEGVAQVLGGLRG